MNYFSGNVKSPSFCDITKCLSPVTDASPWSEITHGLLGDPFNPLPNMEDLTKLLFYENVLAFLQGAVNRRLNVPMCTMKQTKEQINKLKVKF